MKKNIYIILLLTIFMFGSIEVNASSGRLRKDSIKTCNGTTYGQHSSDNHWHVAEEKDGSYYATGNPIYSDPCSSNSGSSNNDNSSSNSSSSNSSSGDSSSSNSSSNNSSSNSSSNNNSNGSSNQNNNSSNSSSNNTTTKNETITSKEETPKNNDNTLKVIIIDDKEFEVTDDIEYSTTNEKVDIEVETNDDKATYEIKNNSTLSVGDNKITIEVKAEDGTIKTYNININRKRILSSDAGIKVIIDEEEVNFADYKATVYVESSVKSINFDYTLNNENAKAVVDELSELKTGDNIINIKVTAEDGTEQNYEINIYKYSKTEDVIYTILGFGFLGGIGYGIYYVIKKIKGKK